MWAAGQVSDAVGLGDDAPDGREDGAVEVELASGIG